MKNRIGVYICHCGSNISDYVDVEAVRAAAEATEGVVLAKTTMFACADATQKEMVEDIKARKLDAMVVASCSPKLHLETFRNVAARGGLNPYDYVQVNIREQGSWAHSDNPPQATRKAILLVRAGISRVGHSVPLEPMEIPSENSVVVVGAGITGMRAAIELADMGTRVCLVERSHFTGGRSVQWGELFSSGESGGSGADLAARLYRRISEHPGIELYTGCDVVSKTGSLGNFELTLRIRPRFFKDGAVPDPIKLRELAATCPVEVNDDFDFSLSKRKAVYGGHPGQFPQVPVIDDLLCNRCGECEKLYAGIDLEQKAVTKAVHAGAVLLATGFDPYEPKEGEYGYRKFDHVITLQQLKRLAARDEERPAARNKERFVFRDREIRKIAYIYCVGSRQEEGEKTYCSRYCCTAAMHSALQVGKQFPGIRNIHLTRGIRTYGKQEAYYHEATESGDVFLEFEADSPPKVYSENGKLKFRINDVLTSGRELEAEVDLVVLVTGMEAPKDQSVANVFKVPTGRDRFFNEIHPKLRPVETVIDGVLIAGSCQAPKNILESVASGLSAAAKSHSLISKGKIKLEPVLARIDGEACNWCDRCLDVCPYDAIIKTKVNGQTRAEVNQAGCKGCGMCLPVCPENAIELASYTDAEVEGMIDVLSEAVT